MLNNYAAIPEFGQYAEYITQATPVIRDDGILFYDVVINTVPFDTFDLDGNNPEIDTSQLLDNILNDYKKVAASGRIVDVTDDSFSVLIPENIAEILPNLEENTQEISIDSNNKKLQKSSQQTFGYYLTQMMNNMVSYNSTPLEESNLSLKSVSENI